MKVVLTAVLALLVAGLGAHLCTLLWFPDVIATRYPAAIARLYAGKSGVSAREEVARLEPVEGRPGVSRVVLVPAAVASLGIRTVEVVERPVERSRRIGSQLVGVSGLPPAIAPKLSTGALAAVVELSGVGDAPAPGEAAEILEFDAASPSAKSGASSPARLVARPLGTMPGAGDGKGAGATAFYELAGAHGHEPGDFVMVKVPLARNGKSSKVVPAEAILLEPTGSAWVYVNPAPNVFVREAVAVEAGDGNTAVLRSGPPAGAKVVTTGAYELYGAESSIGLERVGH
ncbi:MAG: hypothetical protein SFW09_06710 [Hyphomicrobiaceae bacterium]|nr:hypothetical protein [Hyphomicrobiaceae bacterium]